MKIPPFNFSEHGQDQASITLEADMKYSLFEKHGIEPNGYVWKKVIQTYLEQTQPELLSSVTFDPEAGMFACYGTVRGMQAIAPSLLELYNDETILESIILSFIKRKAD